MIEISPLSRNQFFPEEVVPCEVTANPGPGCELRFSPILSIKKGEAVVNQFRVEFEASAESFKKAQVEFTCPKRPGKYHLSAAMNVVMANPGITGSVPYKKDSGLRISSNVIEFEVKERP